jgi:DNA-binding MarR family transcriptional regulator
MPSNKINQRHLEHYRKNNIGQPLMEVARDFQKSALVGFSESGHNRLQSSHQAVLAHLGLEGARLTELAEKAMMTKQAMGQLVDEVERLGYVERSPDPSDGRAKIVRFTPKGLELIRRGTEIGDTIQRRYASLIGEEKMGQLRELLEELHYHIRHPRE